MTRRWETAVERAGTETGMIRPALSVALGIVIAAAAIWYLVTPEIIEALRTVAATASWPALALAMLAGAGVQWLRAWRFAIMTTGRLAFPGASLVRIAFQLNMLNFVLPFRLGELSYPVMMRRTFGQPILNAAGVLLLARIFDLCTVAAILCALAAALGLGGSPPLVAALWAVAAALALAPVALVLGARALSRRLASRPRGKLPAALHAALDRRPAELAAIGVSFAIWSVFGALATLAANAVAVIPPAIAWLGAAAGNLAFALPVNGIAGLGASQAAWVFMVSKAGIPWTEAVLSAFAVYAVTLAGALVFGAAAWLLPSASHDRSRP